MTAAALEQILKDLGRVGTRLADHGLRQVWRFDFNGQPHELWFYPPAGKTSFSTGGAEFYGLQSMQKAGVPCRRAVAMLAGFILNGVKGDAVIVEPLEDATPLDQLLCDHEMAGRPLPQRRSLVLQVIDAVEKLGRAKLGHADLRLGRFVVSDGRVCLEGGDAVHKHGLRMTDIHALAADAERFISRSELLRAWKKLGPGGDLPPTNPLLPRLRRQWLRETTRENAHFGQLVSGTWAGHCYKAAPRPFHWSLASRLAFTREDWAATWPMLLKQIEAGQFETIKEGDSGSVLGGRIVVGGHPMDVVVKHPRRQYWYRYFNEIGRGTRPCRAWKMAWQLIHRNVPTGWPLIMMERKMWGYATDALIVFERIDGGTLDEAVAQRDRAAWYRELLRQCGRLLRRLEDAGLHFHDAKTTNWMVREAVVVQASACLQRPAEACTTNMPMAIDVDSIRPFAQGGGLPRLLRSLREQPDGQYTEADALAVVRGYAPFATDREVERLTGISPQRQLQFMRQSPSPAGEV